MLQGTAEDTLLTRWYDSTAVYNIGLFKTVSDSADVNVEYAIELNESIISENHAEPPLAQVRVLSDFGLVPYYHSSSTKSISPLLPQ